MARDVRVNIVGDSSRLERELARADSRMAATGKAAQRMGNVLGAALGGAAIARGAGAVIQTFGRYDTALREVGAVSGATGRKLENLGSIAREAGLQTGTGATEATKAMGELAKAGLSAAEIGPALKGTLALAQAGGLATADAASAAANAMQTFGLNARDTTRIADSFANAANLTTADVGDFALAMSQGGAAAKLAGLDFDDTTLVLTELARIGIKGSDAGTSLKSAFLQLAAPTDAAASAMKKYNLTFFDHNGKVKDAGDISEMLRERLGKLSNQQQVQVLKSIAGTDGFRTLAAMMKVSGDQSDDLSRKLTKQGSASDTAKAKQAGFEGSMNKLRAAGQELGIELGERAAPKIEEFAGKLTKLAQDPAFKEQVMRTLESIGDTAESAWKAIQPGVQLVGKLGSAFAGLPAGVQTTVVQMGALAAVAAKLNGPLGLGAAIGSVGKMRGEMTRLPAATKKAEVAIAASAAASQRAASKFAMPAVPFADLTGSARQQAVIARRQAAAAERIAAAAPAPTRTQRVRSVAGARVQGLRDAGGLRGAGAMASNAAGPVAIAALATTMIAKGLGEAAKSRAIERHAAKYAQDVARQTELGIDRGLKEAPARRIGNARADANDAASKLRNLDAVRGGRSLNLLSDSFRKEYADAQAQARKAAPQLVAAFSTSLKSAKNTDATVLQSRFTAAFAGMPRVAQQGGARAMLEYARGLEKNGRAPQGTVNKLADFLERGFGLIPPKARKAGGDAARALDEGLNDRKLARSSNKLADELADQFSQLPRAAVRTMPGAVAVLGKQLGTLERIAKDKNAAKETRREAERQLPGLRKAYDSALDRVAKRLGLSKDEAKDWSAAVRTATRRAGTSTSGVQELSDRIDTLNRRFEHGRGVADSVREAWRRAGASAKDAADAAEGAGAVAGLPGVLFGQERRRGGRITRSYSTGGLVPAMVSSGEEIEYGGRSMIVPGPRVAADNVPMLLPVGAKVWTEHSQQLRAAGHDVDVNGQVPHFQNGGPVRRFATGGFVSTAYGPPWGGIQGQGVTATGINLKGNPHRYLVAVDPKVIPLHTKTGIWPNPFGYRGKFEAEDTGGAIKGKRIDFYDWRGRSKQNAWGRRTVAIGTPTVAGKAAAGRPGRTATEDRTFTEVQRRSFGRSSTRGGLLADAYSAGLDAVSTFGSRAAARRAGNPVGAAIREALDAQRDSYTRSIERTIPGVAAAKTSAPGRVASSFKSWLQGTAGGGTRLKRLNAALGTMQSIAARKLPYTYGGGHGKLGVGNPGFDCSGFVSAGLGAAGWISSPMATQQGSGLNTLGVSGAGKFLTWGVRGSSGRNAHTMMKIGNSYWESGSGHGPRRVAGWAGKFAYRHMPGYRKGGAIGGRPSGGVMLAGAPRAARRAIETVGDDAFSPRSPNFVGWGYASGGVVGYNPFDSPGLDRLPGFRPTRDATKTAGAVARSASQANLDAFAASIGNEALRRVETMRRELLTKIRRGGDRQTIARLQAAVSVIEADIGGRIAEGVARSARRLEQFDAAKGKTTHALNMEGVDPSSVIGLGATISSGSAFLSRVAPRARQDLVAERERTKREMNLATSKEARATLAAQLTDIRGKIKDLDTNVLGTEEEVAAAKRAIPRQAAAERSANIDLADAMAGLTLGRGDDRAVLEARLAEGRRQFGEAGSARDNAWMTEAAGAMKVAADALRDFDDTQREAGFDFDAAMAALTAGDDDDRAVQERRRQDAQSRLDQALAAGDRERATAAAVDLKGLKDALEANTSAQQEAADRTNALIDLERQRVENQQKILAGAGASRDALLKAITNFSAGDTGATFVRSVATPGVAGGGVRY